MKDKKIDVVANPREVALKILYDIENKGAYSNLVINKVLEESNLKTIDRGFITNLVYGTLQRKLTLDWVIQKQSKLPINKLSKWVYLILQMGVFQLLYTEKIPVSATCNESVKLAKKYANKGAVGFVNAVLRNVARQEGKIEFPNKEKDLLNYFSVKYSHPIWLVEEICNIFDKDEAEKLLEANNEAPKLTIRTNTLRITRDELIEKLTEEGVICTKGEFVDEAIYINPNKPITAIKAFKQGLFQIQDESSMLVSTIVEPKAGEYIIDVCSAPGGKTTHIAQLMENIGKIDAWDIHKQKLSLIQEAYKRLGITIIETSERDASKPYSELLEKADKVLVDAPCSGLGILRRKPEIRWRKTKEDFVQLQSIQKNILNQASQLVKPGGTLIYSTCTIRNEENIDIVTDFLSKNPNYEMCELPDKITKKFKYGIENKGAIKIYPHINQMDGFFIAKLRKGI